MLYVGKLPYGSTGLGRANAIKSFSRAFDSVDLCKYFPSGERGIYSLERLLGIGPHVYKFNRELIHAANKLRPDIIFVDKGLLVYPETLSILSRTAWRSLLVHYSPDDQFNPSNSSRNYRAGIALYDVHITTKIPNLIELKSSGARVTMLMKNGFNPRVHRPIPHSSELAQKYGADISFVGAFEDQRAASIHSLESLGLKTRIWGPGWKKWPYSITSGVKIEQKSVWGEDYVAIVNHTKINLCFLRKVNRDVTTSRSVEIPACCAFMLAERTNEHLEMFEEGKQAEFFSSVDELKEKALFYLRNDIARVAIAKQGLKRAQQEFSYDRILKDIFNKLCEIKSDL